MIKWNEVTWYSRMAAIIVFVGIMPVLNFIIGVQYEQTQRALAYAQILEDPFPVIIIHKPQMMEATSAPQDAGNPQE